MRTCLTFLTLLLLFANPIFAYDRETWTSFTNMNYVTSLSEGDNVIYIATTGGIRRYDKFTKTFLSPLTTLDGLPDNRVQRLAFDQNTGDLWFETPSGGGRWISRLDIMSLVGQTPAILRKPKLQEHLPSVVMPFGYYLEPNRIRGPRQDYPVTETLIDAWGDFWLGTWGLGVGRADMRDEQLSFLRYGPLEENVTAIARDGDAIWFGGEDTYRAPARGITRYHTKSKTWEYFEAAQIIGLDNPQITTILPDSANIWFGTHRGLTRYNRKENRWFTYRDSRQWGRVTALARGHRRLWIGTQSGMAVLNLKDDALRLVKGSENFRITTLVTGPKNIWAGTRFGLYKCPREDIVWHPAQDPDNHTQRSIVALSVSQDKLWAATDAPPGLIRLNAPDSTWSEFPLSEVGGSQYVAVTADTSRVWVATDMGAFRLNLNDQLWKSFTPTDGLIHDRVQALLLEDEYVWFGTAQGVSRFHWAKDFFEKE